MSTTKSITHRFLSKSVLDSNGCWLWTGGSGRGYGTFRGGILDSLVAAHRFSYLMFKGSIPKGLQIDHLCRVKLCVNPNHLEVVTPQENSIRYRITIQKCPAGHVYTPDNLRKHDLSLGRRGCRTCHNSVTRKYYQKKRGEA